MGLVAEHGEAAVLRAIAQARTPEAARGIQAAVERETFGDDWRAWLRSMLPQHFPLGFAPHHDAFWQWVWGLQERTPADPFIAIWPRGGGKSTSAEAAVAAVGAHHTRRYVLYVGAVQTRADDHVENIAAMIESDRMRRLYPALASRKVGLYGMARAWRRNRLRAATGFTVDALGLDVAVRGIKIEEDRPDLIVIDDIDNSTDGPGVVERKIEVLTKAVLPSMARHGAVLGVQNLVHINSIFARLAGLNTEPADFLAKRQVSGPTPALRRMVTERVLQPSGLYRNIITAGEPTWGDTARWQDLLDEIGLLAFRGECQHDVEVPAGGMFDHVEFVHIRRDDMPPLIEAVCVVDPAVTDTDNSDSQAVICGGLGNDGRIFALRAHEQRGTPLAALRLAITWAFIEGTSEVLVETDQGGDTWQSVYREALAGVLEEHPEWAGKRAPRFRGEKAGAGHGPKAHRGAQMVPDYEKGRIVHVIGHGCEDVLERALHRFPRTKPLDLADATWWLWWRLRRWRKASSSTAAGVQIPDRT